MRKTFAALAVAGTLLVLTTVATAEPAPLGPVGSGIEVETPTVVAAADTDTGAVPVQTDENGAPMYLSQDGGDGEHASIAVSQALRDLIQSGNYDNWGLEVGETPLSDENQTVFFLKSGDTYFRVTVAPDPTVAPEGTP